MSKRESLARINLIIKKLRRGPCSMDEIMDYLERESHIQGHDFMISARTFHRDLNDIRNLYHLEIFYDHGTRNYRLGSEEKSDYTERILEAFDTYNMLQVSDRLSNRIFFEKRKPLGTEHFSGMLHAIQNRFLIKFQYHKFYEEKAEHKRIEPYALKESKNRWYVIGRNVDTGLVKIYALDRLTHFDITKKRFNAAGFFNPESAYRNSFGIISPEGESPEEITLWLNPLQGKYVKSLPLHPSQEIIRDGKTGITLRVTMHITEDFIMELLSYGESVKVIEPESLADTLKVRYRKALALYEGKAKKKRG
jgi:predicted DNA-binding transcriptional regulator YafY